MRDSMDREQLTVVTRKGQITVPAAIRQALGLKEGDKVAVSLDERGARLRPVRSVTEMTYGVLYSDTPGRSPEEERAAAIEEIAGNAAAEGTASTSGD
jgi:AbrB family looped-hinge helix DNA binding protein